MIQLQDVGSAYRVAIHGHHGWTSARTAIIGRVNPRTELVRLKVERAQKHILELQADIEGFYEIKPYLTVAKRDPNTRQMVYRLDVCSDPPDRFSVITGDVLQNLRSALDHLVWQLVEANGNTPVSTNAFPICEGLGEYQSPRTERLVKGVAPSAKKPIDDTKPYHGGNDTLWKLHRLNNVDKHRLLITVGGAFRHMDIGPILMGHLIEGAKGQSVIDPSIIAKQKFSLQLRPTDRLFPLKQGYELFRDAPDAEWNKDVTFAFEIAFGEPQVAEGEPLLETLQGMKDLVNNLISDFDPFLK